MTPVSRLLVVISRALAAPGWGMPMADHYERVKQVAEALADAMGGETMPTSAALRREIDRANRDELIRDQFDDGLSYPVLAKRHGLSSRQVRRIVKAGDDADIAERVRDRD